MAESGTVNPYERIKLSPAGERKLVNIAVVLTTLKQSVADHCRVSRPTSLALTALDEAWHWIQASLEQSDQEVAGD